MEQKKLALVTCYFQPNFGSQLQAYATQKIFDTLGVPNETIMIDGLLPEINKAKMRYFISRIFDINTIKDKWSTVKKVAARKTHKDYAANLGVRNAEFKQFANNRFKISRRFNSKAELAESAKNYAGFVVGSDQLWLPSNIEGDYYTLNFVPDEVKRISLATSFGVSSLPKKQAKKAADFLNRIDYLSVREVNGQKLIKELTGRDALLACDPTLLFTADQWADIVPKGRRYKEPYIFCYFLGNNPEQRHWVKEVAHATGCKIVQLQHCDEYIKSDIGFADYTPYDVDPAEFIRLIRDADFVMTDSFHCSVFSMLHQKKFFTFRRYNSDGNVSTNSRIYSLLSLVGLENRLMRGNEDVEKAIAEEIVYKPVLSTLAEMRQRTSDFLKEALAGCGLSPKQA